MNNFTIIYRILRILEKTMDCDELDTDMISPEVLGVSQNRWNAIMEMLSDELYLQDPEFVISYKDEDTVYYEPTTLAFTAY